MHDLISDLARFVNGDTCFYLDDKVKSTVSLESVAAVRHSSFTPRQYDVSQRFDIFYEMKRLRTFLAFAPMPSYNYYLSNKVLDDLVPKLRYLRVLSLAGYSLEELPSSIGALKHLRNLNLSHTPIRKLPESLTNLFNLQTLNLHGCWQLVELPVDIGNLINLQYLDIKETHMLREMPLQISKLTNLHLRLCKFRAGQGNGLCIKELTQLPHLPRQLQIEDLNNVVNVQDAELLSLKEKSGLEELALQWTCIFPDSRNESDELNVLNSLQPHQNLKSSQSSWVGHPSFSKLVHMELNGCERITSSPSLGKLPALRHLTIHHMDKVKKVISEDFISLETLRIDYMPAWEHWSNQEAAAQFPKLRVLSLSSCPLLIAKLPNSLPSLKTLSISNCRLLSDLPKILPSLCELKVIYCQELIFRRMPNLATLTNLFIWGISGLVSLSEAFVQTLMALEDLKIEYCKEMKYLWQEETDEDKLVNLKRLKIGECPNLEKLPSELCHLTSLKELMIKGCKKLVSLSEGASSPQNLQVITIEFCDSLNSFPRGLLPSTLKSFTLTHGEKLGSLPEEILFCENFHVSGLSLTYLTASVFPTSLKKLTLHHCRKLQSLTSLHCLSHLTELAIQWCDELESFSEEGLSLPDLTVFSISDCGKLRSLPNHVEDLTSLQHLSIKIPSLESSPEGGFPPNLLELEMQLENIAQPITEWGLCALTSLKELRINGPKNLDVENFPDEDGLLLPTSLTHLSISNLEIVKSISRGIQHLSSLEKMSIGLCSSVQTLPKEGFPTTLGSLEITACPLLQKRCLKDRGDYWPLISHIPYVSFWMMDDRLRVTSQ